MGNVFGTATGASADKGHNLKLVLSILGVVRILSKKLADQIDKRDKRHGYLVNIQTSAGILTAHIEEIRADGVSESFEPQINHLADCLEEVFSDQIIKFSKLKVSKHPRLHAVQEITSTSDDWELYMSDLFDPSNLKSPTAWNKLQRNLKVLTDEMQPYGDNVDETEEAKSLTTSREPDDEVYDFVNRVLDTVPCNCPAKAEHDFRLKIGTYKKGKLKSRPGSLCVLLAQDKSLTQWHELLIHDQPKQKKVPKSCEAEDPTSRAGADHLRSSTSTSCVCKYLKAHTRPDFLRLDVILDQYILRPSSLPPEKRTFGTQRVQKQIDLKSLLSFTDKTWTQPSKWALAVLLAYSLLYLYGGSLAKGQWRRENIIFFRDGTHIPLQPFFGTSFTQSIIGASKDTIKFHRLPEVLELGVILLEIHLGQRLECFFTDGRDITTNNDLYWSAWEVYRKEENQIMSLVYRKVIQACLSPSTFAGTDSDIRKLRSVLFQAVVQPLEEELVRNFQELLDADNLDEEAAEKCDLTLSIRSSNHSSTDSSRSVQHRQDDLHVASHSIEVLPLEPMNHSKTDQIQEGRENAVEDRDFFTERTNQGGYVGWKRGVRWADELSEGRLGDCMTVFLQTCGLTTSTNRVNLAAGTMLLADGNWPRISRMVDERHPSGSWNLSSHPNLTNSEQNAVPLVINDSSTSGATLRRPNAASRDYMTRLLNRRDLLLASDKADGHMEPKIAIIDSGFDGHHPLDTYIEDYEDFVTHEEIHVDQSGHGTTGAVITLKVVPKARVYIARVFEKYPTELGTPSRVAAAIRHATNEWHVDIIALSLGFGREHKEIEKAILAARLEGDILIFAAVGNGGNREKPAFPASMGGSVLPIFSTDGLVKPSSGFNAPTPTATAMNFGFLGETVIVQSKNGEDKYVTGTSIATSLAAAIAAILLDFAGREDCREMSEKENLRSVQGMSAVFAKLSVLDSNIYCFNPWSDLLDPPQIQAKSDCKKRQHICGTINRAL